VRGAKRRHGLALRVANDPVSGDAAPSPEAEVTSEEERGRLLALIEDLPERYRSVVVLRYLLDLSERETSEILGLAAGTVKSRCSRALERLRRRLAVEYGDSK
jgi:RNA polymerase sigma factor (sigma-70 family)